MADQHGLQLQKGGLIFSDSTSSSYLVQNVLGSGSFGVVAQCYNFSSKESVALKMIKDKENTEMAKMEANILLKLKAHNSHKFNIVSLNNSFSYNGHFCLEFELLGENLYEYLLTQRSLELQQIRPIMHQMATALQFLKSVGVVHADLKPENILMVNHEGESLKVKLSDFGLAHDDPEAWTGKTIQTLYYMAPEVLVGAPYREAIDVWSLGCVGAELLMGMPLFAGLDFYDVMRHQAEIVGAPPEHILNIGLYTSNYFIRQRGAPWKLMSPSEAGVVSISLTTINRLSELVIVAPKLSLEDARAERDISDFITLLTLMLNPDAGQRITPLEILRHQFVSMTECGTNSKAPKMTRNLKKHPNGKGHNKKKVAFEVEVKQVFTPVLITSTPIPPNKMMGIESHKLLPQNLKQHSNREADLSSVTCVDPGHNMSELAADVQEEHAPIPHTNMEMPEQKPPEPSAENPQREAAPSTSHGEGTAPSSATRMSPGPSVEKVENIDQDCAIDVSADPPIPPTKTKKTKFQKVLSGLRWFKQLFKRTRQR